MPGSASGERSSVRKYDYPRGAKVFEPLITLSSLMKSLPFVPSKGVRRFISFRHLRDGRSQTILFAFTAAFQIALRSRLHIGYKRAVEKNVRVT